MATEKPKTFGVTAGDTSLSLSTEGVKPSNWFESFIGGAGSFFSFVGGKLEQLGKNMWEGAKELGSAIQRGDIGLFLNWIKEDPVGAGAGIAAVAIGGWFIGAQTGIGAAIANSRVVSVISGAVSAMWARIAAIRIGAMGGLAIGALLPNLKDLIIGGTQTIINLDWMQSDNSILQELKSTHLQFLNTMGESAGRMIAGFIMGGAKNNPQLTINMTAAAALVIQARDEGSEIEEEMINAISDLANSFIRYAKYLTTKLAYMATRAWARENIRTGNKELDEKIKNWGLIENQSFIINSEINEKIEKIEESNPMLAAGLEGLKDGLFEGFFEYLRII